MTDIHAQRLFNDGVSKDDYFTHRQWYQLCPQCNVPFSLVQPPYLLKCGHVCCFTQFTYNPLTPCACCGKPKVLKIAKYTDLFEKDIPLTLKEQKRYNFNLKIATSNRSMQICNQHPNTTWQQILLQFDDFIEFVKRTPQTVITFSAKAMLYSQIKEKPILKQISYLTPNDKNHSNSIMILNRQKGGVRPFEQ